MRIFSFHRLTLIDRSGRKVFGLWFIVVPMFCSSITKPKTDVKREREKKVSVH